MPMGSNIGENIPTVTTHPDGYVTLEEFCNRCEVTKGAVSQAKTAGLIRKSSLRYLKNPKGSPFLLIHWDQEGPAFIRRMKPERWPAWFIQQQHPSHNPSSPGRRPKFTPPVDPDDEGAPGDSGEMETGAEGIFDLATAKLRKEKLAIAKADLELKQSRGQLVEVEVVSGFLKTVAIETRGTLMAMAPRLAPLLAAEKDARKIAAIMEKEITAAMEGLAELERYGHAPKE